MGPPWPTPLTDAVHLGARFSPTERAPQPPNPSAQSTARSLVPFQASFSSSPPFPLGTKFPFFFQSFEPITRHSLSFPSALALVFFFSVLSFAPAPPSQSLPGAFEEREKKRWCTSRPCSGLWHESTLGVARLQNCIPPSPSHLFLPAPVTACARTAQTD